MLLTATTTVTINERSIYNGGKGVRDMDWVGVAVVLAVWFVLQTWVLPKFGVPT